MFALEFAGASKRYGRCTALLGLELAVRDGAAVGLLGPNGAGKTTALRLLLGFARPSGGAVSLRGRDPFDPEARIGVGYLPERLAAPRHTSVRDFLRLHAALAGLGGEPLQQEVDRALERSGLGPRAHDRVGGLSKGLLQRLGFAQALLARPQLLVLDEPTAGLDPLGVRDARDWILEERSRGCTILVSSHVLSEVERVCDQVVILNEGRVAASGALRDLVGPEETLEDAFVRAVRG